MDWYDDTAAAVAEAAGLKEIELDLPDDLREEILELARIASHDSGDRTNAPLLCYALGLAVGKGATLPTLAEVIRSRTDA